MNITATLIISAFGLVFVSSVVIVMVAAYRSGLRGFLIAMGSAAAVFTVLAVIGWAMLGRLDPVDDSGATQGFAFSIIAFVIWVAVTSVLAGLTVGIRNTKMRDRARRQIL